MTREITIHTIRELQVANGEETRSVSVLRDSRGFWLHDLTADPRCESLQQLADDSDTSIMDVLRDGGFEIVPPKTVKVVYWVGTTQREGLAADYAEAMEFAGRNQNAHDPKFYEIATGEQLYDDGNGLRAESDNHYAC